MFIYLSVSAILSILMDASTLQFFKKQNALFCVLIFYLEYVGTFVTNKGMHRCLLVPVMLIALTSVDSVEELH